MDTIDVVLSFPVKSRGVKREDLLDFITDILEERFLEVKNFDTHETVADEMGIGDMVVLVSAETSFREICL